MSRQSSEGQLAGSGPRGFAPVGGLLQGGSPDPSEWRFYHDKGVGLFGQRKFSEAATALDLALQLNPKWIETRVYFARALMQLNRLDDAAAQYQQVLLLQPENAAALHDLGLTLRLMNRPAEAIRYLQQTIKLNPASAEAQNNLATALTDLGQWREAEAACLLALQLKPDYANARTTLGSAYSRQKRYAEAVEQYRLSLALRPQNDVVLNDLGWVLTALKRYAEAVPYLRQALRIDPDAAETQNNLGVALFEMGRFEEAEAAFAHTIQLEPGHVKALTNLAISLAQRGLFSEAFGYFDLALWNDPKDASVHGSRAMALLSSGNYEEGFAEHEAREVPKRPFSQPVWDGSDLTGKTILLWPEQGMGDMMHFIRYAAFVKARGAQRVVVETEHHLINVLQGCPGIDQLVLWDAPPEQRPAFDVHLSVLSLPRIFRTTLDTIPAKIPYLFANPALAERWQSKLGDGNRLRIGIAWQGNPGHRWDHHRSLPLKQFESLAAMEGVQLFSLQRGPGSEQVAANKDGPLKTLSVPLDPSLPEADAWADLAAVIVNMDLIITVDTATAHLAGALGKPVWLLLSRLLDWRWMLDRSDSPWYPTMRLFRQRRLDRWEPVLKRVCAQVTQLKAGRGTK